MVLFCLGNSQSSMNEFQIELLKNPLNVDSFLRYALSLSALGHSEEAVRAAKIAIDSYSPAKSISPLMLRKYFIPEDFVRSDSLVEVKGKNFVRSFVRVEVVVVILRC